MGGWANSHPHFYIREDLINTRGIKITQLNKETIEALKGVLSNPPPGKCKVLNIYVEPSTGTVKVEYDDTPVGG